MRRTVRTALGQTLPIPFDVESNLKSLRAMAEAVRGVADVLVLPELWLTGYFVDREPMWAAAPSMDGPVVATMQEIARSTRVALVVGLPVRAPAHWGAEYETFLLNSAVAIDADGTVAAWHHKTHLWFGVEGVLFRPPPLDSALHDPFPAFRLPATGVDAVFGMLICFEVEFPENVRVHAVKNRADLVFVPTASTGSLRMLNHTLIPARAYENHVAIVYCNFPSHRGAPGPEPNTRVAPVRVRRTERLLPREAPPPSDTTPEQILDGDRVVRVPGSATRPAESRMLATDSLHDWRLTGAVSPLSRWDVVGECLVLGGPASSTSSSTSSASSSTSSASSSTSSASSSTSSASSSTSSASSSTPSASSSSSSSSASSSAMSPIPLPDSTWDAAPCDYGGRVADRWWDAGFAGGSVLYAGDGTLRTPLDGIGGEQVVVTDVTFGDDSWREHEARNPYLASRQPALYERTGVWRASAATAGVAEGGAEARTQAGARGGGGC